MVLLGNTICIVVFLRHAALYSNLLKTVLHVVPYQQSIITTQRKTEKCPLDTRWRSIPIMSCRDSMCISFEMHIILQKLFFWKKDPLCSQTWNLRDEERSLKNRALPLSPSAAAAKEKSRFSEQEILFCRRALWKISTNADWFLRVQDLEEVVLSLPPLLFLLLFSWNNTFGFKEIKDFPLLVDWLVCLFYK